MFEMHSFWPESWTFRYIKDVDFDEYRNVVEEPIALDVIKKRLDCTSREQVFKLRLTIVLNMHLTKYVVI